MVACCLTLLQAFTVPVEERRYHEISEQQFGEQGREQAKICADIMAKTGSSPYCSWLLLIVQLIFTQTVAVIVWNG